MATWHDVAHIVGELPSTNEQAPRKWRVGKTLIAWERPLRQSDIAALTRNGVPVPSGDILGVRVPDEGVKCALIADEPEVYFTIPHFDGYAALLVRLAQITVGDLRELITEAWLTRAPKRLAKDFLAGSA